MNESFQQIPWWVWAALGAFSASIFPPMWRLAKRYQRWLISREQPKEANQR